MTPSVNRSPRTIRPVSPLPPGRSRRFSIRSVRGRPGGLRRAGDAVHVGALRGRAADDAQPLRRRGPRAGDVPPRVSAGSAGSRRARTSRPGSTRSSRTRSSTSYRAKKRRPEQVDLDDVEDFYLFRRLGGLEAVDAERSPRPRCSTRCPTPSVKEALEELPEQFRMAVLLADVEGFSYKEIAEIMDVPIGTVMSRLHRGRKQLQKRLWDLADGTRPGPERVEPARELGTGIETMDCDRRATPRVRLPRRRADRLEAPGDHPAPRRVPAVRRGLRLRDRDAPGRSPVSCSRRGARRAAPPDRRGARPRVRRSPRQPRERTGGRVPSYDDRPLDRRAAGSRGDHAVSKLASSLRDAAPSLLGR